MKRLFTVALACWPLLHWTDPAFSQHHHRKPPPPLPAPIPAPVTEILVPGPMTADPPIPQPMTIPPP